MNWLQDGLEQRLSESWDGFKRRTVEEAHAIGLMLVEAHQTADLREGGFQGVLRRSGIPNSTGYQLVELARRYPEVSSVETYPTVAAALQAPPDEEPEQPELSEAPAEPTAVPEPESLSQERRLTEQAPTADDIDPAIRARMDACLDDTSRSDADLRLMRGNLLNVIDGMLPPALFLERWERAQAAPVVVTPLPDEPEPPTEQAVIANPKEPKPTPGELLERVEAELAEANREKQLLLFDKEDLQQQILTLTDELQQHLGETSKVGGGTAWAEVRKLQAEARSFQSSMMVWQQKFEDERRRAKALERELKKLTG